MTKKQMMEILACGKQFNDRLDVISMMSSIAPSYRRLYPYRLYSIDIDDNNLFMRFSDTEFENPMVFVTMSVDDIFKSSFIYDTIEQLSNKCESEFNADLFLSFLGKATYDPYTYRSTPWELVFTSVDTIGDGFKPWKINDSVFEDLSESFDVSTIKEYFNILHDVRYKFITAPPEVLVYKDYLYCRLEPTHGKIKMKVLKYKGNRHKIDDLIIDYKDIY